MNSQEKIAAILAKVLEKQDIDLEEWCFIYRHREDDPNAWMQMKEAKALVKVVCHD
jgi:hypothetical protein